MSVRRPNILVFMTDHQQGATIDPAHPCLTPNSERLQAAGLRFPRTYTTTAHCCPARASFMTGLYPSRHGVWNNVLNEQAINRGLAPGVATFGEALRGAGYRMAYSGKWHVSALEGPEDRGWDVLTAGAVPGDRHGKEWGHWDAMATGSHDAHAGAGGRGRGVIQRPGWGDYRLYGANDNAGRWDERCVDRFIDALPGLASGSAPWCAFVGPNGPHDPYVVPKRYLDMYRLEDVQLPPSWPDTLEDKPRVLQRQRRQVWGQLTEDEVREAILHYRAYCTWMDELLGRCLDALDASGCAEDTVVIQLSDHGDYAGAHGLFAKGVAAFDEAYRVPGAIRWPAGIVNPGRVVDEFVTLADIAPTIMELAGVPVPPGLTGRSLMPFLKGETPGDWPDAAFTQFNGVELYYSQRVVVTKEWKYVFNGFDFDELYHLAEDPHEMVNLADLPEYRDVVRDMVTRMWRFARREGDGMHNDYITVGLAPFGPGVGL